VFAHDDGIFVAPERKDIVIKIFEQVFFSR
jgi:hypothetical protein